MKLKGYYFLALAVVLAGCDSSSSDSSVTYSGATTAAVISDQSTASAIAADVVGTGGAADALPAGVQSSGTVGIADIVNQLQVLKDIAENIPLPSPGGALASGVVQTYTGSMTGCSGRASGSLTMDDRDTVDTADDLLLSMSISFSNYIDRIDPVTCSSLTLNGSVNYTFEYDAFDSLSRVNYSFSRYSASIGGATYVYNGSFVWEFGASGFTFTMNVDYQIPNGKVYRAENYAIELDSFGRLVSVSGRLYNPDYGYVDIATTTPLSYAGGCSVSGVDVPDVGTITLTGQGSGSVTVDANSGLCNTYTLNWITSGGVPGGPVSVNW